MLPTRHSPAIVSGNDSILRQEAAASLFNGSLISLSDETGHRDYAHSRITIDDALSATAR